MVSGPCANTPVTHASRAPLICIARVRSCLAAAETTLPSAAPPLATRSERYGGAGTAGGYRPVVRRLPGLCPGLVAAQHMPPGARRLCRSSHGAGYSQWRRSVAAPHPDTRPEFPPAAHSARTLRAGTPGRRVAGVSAGWLPLYLYYARQRNPYYFG